MPVSFEIIKLTPEKARKLVDSQVLNRPISKARVEIYASEMRSGRWSITGQGIILDSRGRMLDGQHRCQAVIASGVTIDIACTKGLDESVFDLLDQGHPRGVSDVLPGISNANKVAAGLRIMWRDHLGLPLTNNLRLSPRDGRELLDLHPGIVTSASWCAGKSMMRKMLRGGVCVYAHYKSHTIDAPKAGIFWERIADGAGLSARSPILGLRNVLMQPSGTQLTETHQLALVIKAWNDFRAGRHRSFIRYSPNAGEAFPAWDA